MLVLVRAKKAGPEIEAEERQILGRERQREQILEVRKVGFPHLLRRLLFWLR